MRKEKQQNNSTLVGNSTSSLISKRHPFPKKKDATGQPSLQQHNANNLMEQTVWLIDAVEGQNHYTPLEMDEALQYEKW